MQDYLAYTKYSSSIYLKVLKMVITGIMAIRKSFHKRKFLKTKKEKAYL